MEPPIPDYVQGTFEWDNLGYHFALEPPSLPDPTTLPAEDVWGILASTFRFATRGDWRGLPRLIGCLDRSSNALIWQACADLLGDAASPALLRQTLRQYEQAEPRPDAPLFEEHLAFSLHQSGLLWTVPVLLEFFLRRRDRKESKIIASLLSHMLEDDIGPVALANLPEPDYRRLVLEQFDELKQKHGTEGVSILNGQLRSPTSLAERLLADTRQPHTTWISYNRHLLEAITGIDCRSFYQNRGVQPLAAAAFLEETLESGVLSKYAPGVRYFFGHRIPEMADKM
jgi:hypothetical protein